MPNVLQRTVRVLRSEGLRVAICRGVHKVLGVPGEIDEARTLVNSHLRTYHNNKVAYGPFKGMHLPEDAWWGSNDVASKILGTYEQKIAESLQNLADPEGVLLDIGAADGYFVIGCLLRGFFSHAICFELSEAGQQKIRENAELNGVSDAISIFGEADRARIITTLAEIPSGVIICDIEGGEFELFDTDLLRACGHLHIIIELHDRSHEQERRAKLIERARELFMVGFLRSADIEIDKFPELYKFRDDFRLLAFSEGRGRMGDWLLLSPTP